MPALCSARTIALNSRTWLPRSRRRTPRAGRRSRASCSPSSCAMPRRCSAGSETKWWIGSSSTAVTPRIVQVVDGRRMGETGVRAAQLRRDVRVLLGEPAHVQLVDHRVVPRDVRPVVVAPREGVVDDHRARHVRRRVGVRCPGTPPGRRRSRPRVARAYGSSSSLFGLWNSPGRRVVRARRPGTRSAGPGRRRAGSRARRDRSVSASGMRVSSPFAVEQADGDRRWRWSTRARSWCPRRPNGRRAGRGARPRAVEARGERGGEFSGSIAATRFGRRGFAFSGSAGDAQDADCNGRRSHFLQETPVPHGV